MAIVIIVALGAIGWYGWNNMGGSLSQSPEDMLATMQQNMMEVESAHFTGSVNFTGKYKSDLVPTSEFLPMDGAQDATMKEGMLSVDMTGAFANVEEDYEGYIDFVIGYEAEGETGNIALAMRTVDEMSYIKLGALDIPMGDDSAQMVEIISGIVSEKWVSLPAAEDGKESPVEVNEKMEELIKQLSFLKDMDVVGTERIHGEKTAHITAKVHREDMRTFMMASREDDPMTAEEKADMESLLDVMEGMDIELWIGVSDSLLYKVQLAGPVVDAEQGVDGNINIMLEMYDYDKDVEVVAPEGAMTFEQVVGQVMGAMMFGMMGTDGMNMMDLEGGMPAFDMPIE